jgi:hypothetical protein
MAPSDTKMFGKQLREQFMFDERWRNLNHGKIASYFDATANLAVAHIGTLDLAKQMCVIARSSSSLVALASRINLHTAHVLIYPRNVTAHP